MSQALQCPRCHGSVSVPDHAAGQRVNCPHCEQSARPVLEHKVGRDSDLARHTLAELGIPPYDIVRVVTEQGEHFCLLAADREAVMTIAPTSADAN